MLLKGLFNIIYLWTAQRLPAIDCGDSSRGLVKGRSGGFVGEDVQSPWLFALAPDPM